MSHVFKRECRARIDVKDPTAMGFRVVSNEPFGESENLRYGDPGTNAILSLDGGMPEIMCLRRLTYSVEDGTDRCKMRFQFAPPPLSLIVTQFDNESPAVSFDQAWLSLAHDPNLPVDRDFQHVGFTGGRFDEMVKAYTFYLFGDDPVNFSVEEAWNKVGEADNLELATFWFGLNLTESLDLEPVMMSHKKMCEDGYLFGSETGRTVAVGLVQIVKEYKEHVFSIRATAIPFDAVSSRAVEEAEMRRVFGALGQTAELLGAAGGHA
jgi:hypothetical protein